jgi:hypothetical protein
VPTIRQTLNAIWGLSPPDRTMLTVAFPD